MTSSSVARKASSSIAPALALLLAAGCSSGKGVTVGTGGSSSGGTTMSGGTAGSGSTAASGGTTSKDGSTASGGTTSKGGTIASGGTTGNDGSFASGGTSGKGGTTGTGGTTGNDGSSASGGTTGKGGTTGTGGEATSGGVTGSGGNPGSGGSGKGGTPGSGGTGKGGTLGSGGVSSMGGATGTGGQAGAGGAAMDGGTGTTTIDCTTAMPTGGQQHSGNTQGGTGNLAWKIWSSQSTGTLTTFGDTPAFTVAWKNSGDYLGRLGFQWGDSGKTYDAYGTITAQYAQKKTGTGGSYSYIGIYGTSPCIEWYIVDDSFDNMPVDLGNATYKGSVTIDDGAYVLYTLQISGTSGSECNGTWMQYYSVRKTARQCGQISLTKHFDAWKAAGMTLGNLQEAGIFVEAAGGSGNVDFSVASITAQ